MTPPGRPSEEEIKAKYKDVLALCWWNDGSELLLLRGDRDESYLCRQSWPDEAPFLQSDTNLWETAFGLAAPRRAPFAAVAHASQGDTGFVIVDLRKMDWIPGADHGSSEMIRGFAFTPDDRLIVALYESEPDPDEDLVEDPGMTIIGALVIGTIGEWDYLELPLMVPKNEARAWPRADALRPLEFVDERRVTFEGPGGKFLTLDVEKLRTDPRWLEARARQRRTEKQEREEEEARLRDIGAHNTRAIALAKQLELSGLTCPYCGRQGKDFRYHPGTSKERALLLCPGCSRTMPI